MARPRKPYGTDLPGRVPSTMIRVLAAEMSDQQRLSRGKRYYTDDAVTDIVIGHGAVSAEVQGSRYEPYVVTIEADAGEGMPSRRELWVQCTCPDDTGTGTDLCKHAVATMFALSDEIALNPELVDRWRAGRKRASIDRATADAHVAEHPASRRGDVEAVDDERQIVERASNVIPLRGRTRSTEPRPSPAPSRDPSLDALPALLQSPAGASPPEFPDVDAIDHDALPDPMIRDVLDDALAHLDLHWE